MQTEGGEEHTAAKLLAALVCTLIGATGVALLLIVACTHSQPQKVSISASSGNVPSHPVLSRPRSSA